MSGAGEMLDEIRRDLEDLKVLAADGGSHRALQFALEWV